MNGTDSWVGMTPWEIRKGKRGVFQTLFATYMVFEVPFHPWGHIRLQDLSGFCPTCLVIPSSGARCVFVFVHAFVFSMYFLPVHLWLGGGPPTQTGAPKGQLQPARQCSRCNAVHGRGTIPWRPPFALYLPLFSPPGMSCP